MHPTTNPTASPSAHPTTSPSQAPTTMPTETPTERPTTSPTDSPTTQPTMAPTQAPTFLGGGVMIRTLSICTTSPPTLSPTARPTTRPTTSPTEAPTRNVLTDCAVGDWTASTTCSASCGVGTQTYTREITTWPANGGAACPSLSETRSCSSGPCIVNVTVTPSFVDSTKTKYINPTEKVILGVTTSSLSSSSALSYVWTTTSDALSTSSNLLTSSKNQFLVFKKSSLTAGSAYAFTIKVTDGYGYATSSVSLTANQAPNSGSVYAEPESGTALTTSFKFWTEDWNDPEEHYPLTYMFTTSILGVPVTLGAKSNVSSITNILLPMPTSGSQVTIVYTVSDHYGASTTKSKNVTVTSTTTSANAASAVNNQTKLAASLIADGTPTSALKAVVIMSSSAISLDSSISASADSSTTAASVRESFLTLAKNLSSFASNSDIGSSIVTSLASCVAKATSVPSEMSSSAVTSALSVLSSVTSHPTTLSGAVDSAGSSVIQAVSNLVDAGLLNSTSSSCDSSSLTTVTNVVKAVHNASAQNMAPGEDATSFSSNNINIKSQVLSSSASSQKTSVKNPTSSRTTSFAVPAAWTSSCGDGGLGMLSVQWSSNKYGCVQSGASSAVPKTASSSEMSLSCATPGYSTSFNTTKKVGVTITNAKKPKGRRLSTPETFTVECALGSTTHHQLTCTTDAGSYVYYANCTGAHEELTYTCPTGYTTSKCVAWNSTTSSWSSDSCVTTSNTTAIELGIVTCDCGGTDLNIGLVEGDNKFYGESLTRTAIIESLDDNGDGTGGGSGSGSTGGSGKKKSSAGAAAGGAIAGILVLAIAGLVIYARKTGRPQWIADRVGAQRSLLT